MARFILIDQSLVDRGGHHYDYSTCIIAAAKELGFETLVAANRKVASDLKIDQSAVLPAFSETVYQKDSCLAGLRHLKRTRQAPVNLAALTGWQRTKAMFSLRRFHYRRARIVSRFAKDFQNFFNEHPVADDDHVFLTTVSELELMGLAKYLRANPSSVLATWHLQFHFNVFDGRTPEYDSQKITEGLARSSFQGSLADLTCHRLFFYTTSLPLAEQYNRLDVGNFVPLPYPVAPEFAPQSEGQLADEGIDLNEQFRGRRPPLTFACPGQIRREKGCSNYLQPLVDSLWDSHLATGKIKIALQRPRKKFLRKEKIELQMPPSVGGAADADQEVCSPFQYYPHPLSRPDYINFLRSADCGLLMYDSRVYYSRRAGVLGEMLSCGKPLIVPAGSWLAAQIAEPNFDHANSIESASSPDSRWFAIEELKWSLENAPSSGGVISFDGQKHPFKFSLNRLPKEHLLKIAFQWKWPTVAGTYCKISITQRDETGDLVDQCVQIIGHRDGDRLPNALFRLNAATDSVDVSLSNAFGNSTAMIKQLSVAMLVRGDKNRSLVARPFGRSPKSTTAGQHSVGSVGQLAASSVTEERRSGEFAVESEVALGKVGIVVADQSQLAAAVVEMERHFEYYRESARAFADHWFARHRPKRTIAHLIGAGCRGHDTSSTPELP